VPNEGFRRGWAYVLRRERLAEEERGPNPLPYP
jgi:hypothetical protein